MGKLRASAVVGIFCAVVSLCPTLCAAQRSAALPGIFRAVQNSGTDEAMREIKNILETYNSELVSGGSYQARQRTSLRGAYRPKTTAIAGKTRALSSATRQMRDVRRTAHVAPTATWLRGYASKTISTTLRDRERGKSTTQPSRSLNAVRARISTGQGASTWKHKKSTSAARRALESRSTVKKKTGNLRGARPARATVDSTKLTMTRRPQKIVRL